MKQEPMTREEYEKWVEVVQGRPISELYEMGLFIKECECGECCGWSVFVPTTFMLDKLERDMEKLSTKMAKLFQEGRK